MIEKLYYLKWKYTQPRRVYSPTCYHPYFDMRTDIKYPWLHRIHMAHLLDDYNWFIKEWYSEQERSYPDEVTFYDKKGFVIQCTSEELKEKSIQQIINNYHLYNYTLRIK